MARPEEKSQSMLHRYLRSRAGDDGGAPGRPRGPRRPYLATLCEDVDEAGRWRQQVLRDISRKVSDIQNPGLGDERTRELNDEVNKLLREKRHWERRIRELGGKNYAREAVAPVPGVDGALLHRGYFYFGAARDLPGVAALVESDRRALDGDGGAGEFDDTPIEELLRRVDPAQYYGFEDGELAAAEERREAGGRKALVEAWEAGDGAVSVEDGIAWDAGEWEDVVGQPPVAGDALDAALRTVELEEQKLAAIGAVERVAEMRQD